MEVGLPRGRAGSGENVGFGEPPEDVFRALSRVMEGRGRFVEAADSWNEVLTNSSSDSDWCRLIYLAFLAGMRLWQKMALTTCQREMFH